MKEYRLKLALLGEGGVGKTTFAQTFKNGIFTQSTMTIAVEFHVKKIKINDQQVVLQIWDLGGQDQFKNMGLFPTYLRGTQGAALCFDITDLDTLDYIPNWIKMLPTNVPMILVGLKTDLLDASDNLEEINGILDNYTFIDFVAVSSKNYSSTRNVFLKLVKFILESREKRIIIGQENVEEIIKSSSPIF